MSSRTKWWLGVVMSAALSVPSGAWAQPGCAPGAACPPGGGTGLGHMTNYGPPVTEMPLPLMWGERDEGPFFAMEAVVMRINNPLKPQVIAVAGFFDDTGLARGDQTGPLINVLDGRNANTLIARLWADPGIPGQFVGSGTVRLTTGDLDGTEFTPGAKMTFGYRLRNGIVFDVSYMQLIAARQSAAVGIIPQRDIGLGADLANSFVTVPFFNYTPQFAGPSRDVISDVFLFPIPALGNVSLVTPGTATGAPNEVITDDAAIDDIIANRGTPIAAYGIGNAAEVITVKYRQQFATGELNARVPIFQGEVTRTYGTGGFRYIYLQERYRMYVDDLDIDGNFTTMRYTNRVKNRYFGAQAGLGSEAYLGSGWAVSVEVKGGVLAENSQAETEITDFFSSFDRSDNQFGVAGMATGSVYLWWYPIEGIQLRCGYEYMGLFGVRRSPNPIDYDLGRLRPVYENKYLQVDGFTVGVGFVF